MDMLRQVPIIAGCHNPLCPRANWSEPRLPRWWLRLDDGQISEFAACDEGCARMALRFLNARLGRGDEPAAAPLAAVVALAD
ncbi:MAG: hypothetical protein IT340_20800 [Chloroflexi bacterium]|nr:hypothetical protein [Chloroflexota bacterium]